MSNNWEHSNYDDAFEAIKLMAKTKMVMNYHKGDISDHDTEWLFDAIRSEIRELELAVETNKSDVHIVEEAADVLNFLVAIVHKSIKQYRMRKSNGTIKNK